ncbi:hypothetical protein, partial [Nocardiopsis halotolerans]|uniref:hypothetical protein n=1 Tax=Nocardiopsis halotolerans TaxID=124252 RepID=UPI0006891149
MAVVPQPDSPTRIRQVLNAPRGQRFVRPSSPSRPKGASHTTGAESPTREQLLLTQMRDNPRVAYRLEHGELPPWMHIQSDRILQVQASRASRTARSRNTEPVRSSRQPAPPVPRPRPAPDDTPRRPLPRRPRRHRKPRRR